MALNGLQVALLPQPFYSNFQMVILDDRLSSTSYPKGMRNKAFSYHDDLAVAYGMDRAMGRGARTPSEMAMEALEEQQRQEDQSTQDEIDVMKSAMDMQASVMERLISRMKNKYELEFAAKEEIDNSNEIEVLTNNYLVFLIDIIYKNMQKTTDSFMSDLMTSIEQEVLDKTH